MNHEQQEVAEQLRSGQYFKDARSWYETVYIGPISERAFFLVVLVLAGLVALIGLVAFMRFMPLTAQTPVMITLPDAEGKVPHLAALRERGEPLGAAMERFLLQEYVARREGYNAADYAGNRAFVRAHSEPGNFQAYDAVYGQANPRSPVSILAATGKRLVTVDSVEPSGEGDLRQAVVKFSTELEGVGTQAKTQWTATLGYYYSPLRVAKEGNAEQAASAAPVVEDPQFRVVSYAISQTP